MNYFIYFFETFLFALVMFNLLIAIISKTFEVFDEDKDLTNIQELFDIFVELSAFVQFFSAISCSNKNQKSYLHIITYDEAADNMLENLSQQLGGKIPYLVIS